MTGQDTGQAAAQGVRPPGTAPSGTAALGAVEPAEFDLMPLAGRLAVMNRADAAVPALVAAAAPQVAALVERAVAVLRAGGRVVYLGAGSAGRIAAQDAAEVGPTYGVEGAFVAVVAGGAGALRDAAEGLEDDEAAAADDLTAVGLGAADLLVAVSASGSTPYTRAGLASGRARGALGAAVVCAAGSPMAGEADLAVVVPVGPEVVEGSTRLAAGTAQKLVLNQLSTLAMVGLGHVYGNLMIGVRADNAKLRARAHRAVATAAGVGELDGGAVDAALTAAGGEARVALVMLRLGVDAPAARARLAAVAGDVRAALGERDLVPSPRLRTAPRAAGSAVGVDVGGTKIAAALVDASGHVTARSELPTPGTAGELDRALVAAVTALRPGPGVPVGVATAGLVDEVGGVVTGVNVPWVAHPVRARLSALLGSPVAVENDANAAAWAEHRFGAGRGAGSLVLLTIGTGLGGGFVLHGRLEAGAHGLAAEVGHVCLVAGGRPCPCGLSGCWERYTSGSSLAAEAARLEPAWLPGDRAAVGPAAVAAAHEGDAVAVQLLAEQGRRLGQGIAMLTSVLDPDVVVVGGGMAALGELLFGPARAALAAGVCPALPRTLPPIVLAALGNDAGVVGAADLARDLRPDVGAKAGRRPPSRARLGSPGPAPAGRGGSYAQLGQGADGARAGRGEPRDIGGGVVTRRRVRRDLAGDHGQGELLHHDLRGARRPGSARRPGPTGSVAGPWTARVGYRGLAAPGTKTGRRRADALRPVPDRAGLRRRRRPGDEFAVLQGRRARLVGRRQPQLRLQPAPPVPARQLSLPGVRVGAPRRLPDLVPVRRVHPVQRRTDGGGPGSAISCMPAERGRPAGASPWVPAGWPGC